MSSFYANEINISSTELIKNTKLPILILDPLWLGLFPKDHKSENIFLCEALLLELLKEQSTLIAKEKNLKFRKKFSMTKIQSLMTAVYENEDQKAIKDMEKHRSKILNINVSLDETEQKLYDIEENISNTNTALLEETVRISYDLMKKAKNKMEELTPKIEALRKELYLTVLDHADNDEVYYNTYNLLYKLLGKDIINALDSETDTKEKRKWF